MQELQLFLNKVRIGYKCRSVFITLAVTQENLNILSFFFEKGLIKKYTIKYNKIFVYLRYTHNKPLFFKIKALSTRGFRKYFSNKGLTHYKRNLLRSSLVLLFSSYGLITLNQALDYKIGGELVHILYE